MIIPSGVSGCDSNPCSVNAVCEDTAESYTCTCNEGYTGDGVNCTGNNKYPIIAS